MTKAASVDLNAITCLDGVVMRLVEQQGSQATRRITESLDEQAYLEAFLETSKPALPDAEECPVRHQLLLTPFRYRKSFGSRFSMRWERGLFYGSRSRLGCLLEGAYYELVFQSGPEKAFPHAVAMRKTLFHVEVNTLRGMQLQGQGAKAMQRRLRDPCNVSFTQATGQRMREAGIEAFEYQSARSDEAVVQFGAISCCVFKSNPFDQVDIQVEANAEEIVFRCLDDNSVRSFKREQFEVDAVLPQPSR